MIENSFLPRKENSQTQPRQKTLQAALLILALLPYLLYIAYIISTDHGPVDYETFMEIGGRLLNGQPVYGVNSYYPMPYVMIFAFFAWLPRPVSMLVWFMAPVLAVLVISRGKPGLLLFGPVFSHFLGGQTAFPAMLGLWGYRARQQPDNVWGGVWLAVITIKPQLAVFPVGWAVVQWVRYLRLNRRIPRQLWAFMATTALIYLPAFALQPGWVQEWLSTPRPLFIRALAGFIPRTLLYFLPSGSWVYWLALGLLAGALFLFVWWKRGRRFDFDLVMITSYLANPLVHDYDLIQMVPLLDTKQLQKTALLVSIPAWLVMLFAYQWDTAWYVFTLIPVAVAWQVMRDVDPRLQAPEASPDPLSHHSGGDAATSAPPPARRSYRPRRP